jgi:uncharacterized protein
MTRLFIIALSVLLSGCSSFDQHFFYPDSKTYQTPTAHGLDFEELRIASSDGTELSAWFLPAVGKAEATIVHLHGNAQNMSSHFSFTAWLPKAGFNLMVFDYRGYGKSKGAPSRDGLLADSIAAIRYVKTRADVDPSRVILLGQSVGGAMAIAASGSAKCGPLAGVVVDSAFASYPDVGAHVLAQSGSSSSLVGAGRFLVSNRHGPEKHVGKISPTPLLIYHAKDDPIVPFSHGERLYAKAGEPKQFMAFESGGHTCALAAHRERTIPQLLATFRRWTATAQD